MSNQTTTPADLEKDGITYAIASACAQAVRETAGAVTAERLIHLAAHKLAEDGYPVTSGSVAAFLNDLMKVWDAATEELRQAERKTVHETSETLP